jgi:hypothetical protein
MIERVNLLVKVCGFKNWKASSVGRICINLFLPLWLAFLLLAAAAVLPSPVALAQTASEHFTYIVVDNKAIITDYSDAGPKDVVIPATLGGHPVTEIGEQSFRGGELTSVVIPNSVTTIGKMAFSINQFASLNIPDSVSTIGKLAFANNQLASVTIGNSVTTIGEGAFYSNKLTSVTIPDSVITIGDGAFYLNRLTSVSIGNSVTTIGNEAFYFNKLTSVTIPVSVTTIGDSAFGSNLLTIATIYGRVVSFGGNVFSFNPSNLALHGYKGSTVETYANNNNHIFVALLETEVKNVIPENGSATVNFPISGVVINIETDVPGTISITRYPSHSSSNPEGSASAGIFLDIIPSASLQGKPATFTVNYSLPLPGGVDESTLKLYRWSGSAWTAIPDQVLDTTAKTITASVTGFSTFGVFGTSSDADSSTRQTVITRFSRIISYSGVIDHEHKYSLINGVAGMVAAGRGELGGTHEGATLESSRRNAFYSNAYYQITTAEEALPSEYMRIVSAYSDGTERAARSGVEVNPGGTGSVNESAASSSDSKGTYSTYDSNVETTDGNIVVESAVDSASISINVEGTGFVYFNITTDGGGQKTGWWDIP